MIRSPRRDRGPSALDALILFAMSMALFLGVLTCTARPAQFDRIVQSRTPYSITTQLAGAHR